MRRRETANPPMSVLAALSVRWWVRREDEQARMLVLRLLGRLPDDRDRAEASSVLGRLR